MPTEIESRGSCALEDKLAVKRGPRFRGVALAQDERPLG